MCTTSANVSRWRQARRWAVALLISGLISYACWFLGWWQYHRHETKARVWDLVQNNNHHDPVGVGQVLSLDSVGTTACPSAVQWRNVHVTGRFRTDQSTMIRYRTRHEQPGFQVMVPLVLTSLNMHQHNPVLLVDRGWIPADITNGKPMPVASLPATEVTITVRLIPYEPSDGAAASAGSATRITPQLSGDPNAALPCYGQLVAEVAAPPREGRSPLTPLPSAAPEGDLGPHLAYAWQWWLGGALAPIVAVVIVIRTSTLTGSLSASNPAPNPNRPSRRAAGLRQTELSDEQWEDAQIETADERGPS